MSDLIRIPFHGSELLAVEIDGRPHIVLKPAIEAIGMDYDSQRQKLDTKSWATKVLSTVVAADGRARQMLAVDVRTFLMLLATIDERRVNEDVRPLLVAYQSEVADVVEQYFIQGGAINPRATVDQLSTIAARALQQAQVLRALDGIVDSKWLEAKARHVAARALGEEPEIVAADRPLTVGEYLEEKDLASYQVRRLSPQFGKRLKAAFYAKHGRSPQTVDRFIDGAIRPVAAYTESDRRLFDQVYADLEEWAFGAAS